MAQPSRLVVALRRLAPFSVCWVLAAGLYLLLIDTTSLPELLVGAGAVTLSAIGFELAREQHVLGAAMRARWLVLSHRPIAKVPGDMLLVSIAAVAQVVRRRPARGEFRAVRFSNVENERLAVGRRALAESLGSFAPNTLIVGVDPERELILAHQLKRTGGREAIDLLKLG
jgi:hypothetical protein